MATARATPRAGRPRGFDRDRALDTAMRLFWRHGYEGVSVNDLTRALEIAPTSLYAAFGSKADLYRTTIARYERMSSFADAPAVATAQTLEQAVRGILLAAVDAVAGRERERGCMVSDGLASCGAEHGALSAHLVERRRVMRRGLAKAFERWLDKPAARSLARYVAAILQGLSIQARDGASPADLRAVADIACAAVARR